VRLSSHTPALSSYSYPTVDLASLSTQQLSQVKKQLDEEVQHLSNSYQNLKRAQQKFRECVANVQNGVAKSTEGWSYPSSFNFVREGTKLAANSGKQILVPLTSSLYVPGTLTDTENVIVDVGTGFYVEKSTKDAETFYNGKIEELGSNIKDLENIVNGKGNNLRMVEEVLRQKMLSEGQGGSSK
jgi:prefoldin alpha subunit